MFAIPLNSQQITVNTGNINAAWGGITGTLSDQLDLQSALDAKLAATTYTASDVLAKLLTVDGASSLLDSDLLDGQQGTYYLAWANFTGVPATFTPSAHTHLQADITDLTANETIDHSSVSILTQYSLTGGGNLTATRTLNLVNDVASPAASQYYGTDGSGTRGWFNLPTGGGGNLDSLTDVTISAASVNDVLQFTGSIWEDLPLAINQLANPTADKTFTMANHQLKFSYTAPATADGGFEIEATGGFSGDLVHIHQHTGNPGAGTDLLHLECVDTDVLAQRIVHSGVQGLRIEAPSTTQQNGHNISILNPGGYTGSTYPGIIMTVYSSGTGHPFYGWRIAKGTEAAPTAASFPNTLGVFAGYAYDGSSFVEQARFGLSLGSGFGAGTPKGRFFVGLNNGAIYPLVVFESGNTVLGGTSPIDNGFKLEVVNGTAKMTDSLIVGNTTLVTNSKLTVLGISVIDGRLTLGNVEDTTAVFGVRSVSSALSGVINYGVSVSPVFPATATTSISGIGVYMATSAAFTCGEVSAYHVLGGIKGSATWTNYNGLYITDLSLGANNYGVRTLLSAASGKWNIFAGGSARNYFAGKVNIGATTETNTGYIAEIYGRWYSLFTSAGNGQAQVTLAHNTGEYTDTTQLSLNLIPTIAASGTYNSWQIRPTLRGVIPTGITNSGSWIGYRSEVLRNYIGTGDAGTLTELSSQGFLFGHYNTDGAASPTTTKAVGAFTQLYKGSGTITTAIDLELRADSLSGATITNRWGIYQLNSGNNTFNSAGGNFLIGTVTDSGYKLDVRHVDSASTSGTLVSCSVRMTHSPASNSTADVYGQFGRVDTAHAGGISLTAATGFGASVVHSGAGSIVTAAAVSGYVQISGSGSIGSLINFYSKAPLNSAGTVTAVYGLFQADVTISGATSVYAMRSQISSGTGKWNLYLDGTARNYMAGNLLLGTITDLGYKLQVVGTASIGTGGLSISDAATIAPVAGGIILDRASAPFIQFMTGGTARAQVRLGATAQIGLYDSTGSNAILVGTTDTRNVLIGGTTDNGFKLEVTGTAKISGAVTLTTALTLGNGGTGATSQAGAANAILPSQATNGGKFLTTDGSNVSWATVTGGASTSPGGTDTQVQFNDGGVFGADADFIWDKTNNILTVNGTGNFNLLQLNAGAIPSAPATGVGDIFAVNRAGKLFPAFIGPSGVDFIFQAALHNNKIKIYYPTSGTTGTGGYGTAWTSTATVSHPTPASTDKWTQVVRTRWQTSTTAGNASGVRESANAIWRGNAAERGGFYFFARFSQQINLNGGQVFVGLKPTAALGGDPSALTNMIGVGYDAADASTGNWFLMRNDGTGTATKVDLGTNAARNTTHFYDLQIHCAPNDSKITVRLVNEFTNTVILDNVEYTTDLPTNTTFMAMHAVVRNGAVAAAANIEVASLYCYSDY